jgi:hypothetical protein
LLGNGNFKIKNGNRSIILEAIVDQPLWIWHVFFGLPNGNNDINALDWLPLVTNLFRGLVVDMEFVSNGKTYPNYYLFVNDLPSMENICSNNS